jgi:hypothetical protein
LDWQVNVGVDADDIRNIDTGATNVNDGVDVKKTIVMKITTKILALEVSM